MKLIYRVIQKLLKPVIGKVVDNGGFGWSGPLLGGGGVEFYAATQDPQDSNASVVQLTGEGTPTTTHAVAMWALDYEGVVREFAIDEPVWKGGRRVNNTLVWSEDLTNDAWDKINGAEVTADTITFVNSDSAIRQRQGTSDGMENVEGSVNTVSFTVYGDETEFEIELVDNGDGNPSELFTASVTSTPTRYSFEVDWTAHPSVNDSAIYVNRLDKATAGATVTFTDIQVEQSTGRSDTETPSEYIKTEAAVVTKIFNTTNGNSVASNVVTEADGVLLDPQPMLVAQEELTNLFIESTNASVAPWNTRGTATVTQDQIGIRGIDEAYTFSVGVGLNDIYSAANPSGGSPGDLIDQRLWLKRIDSFDLSITDGNANVGEWIVDMSLISNTEFEMVDRNHPAVTIATEWIVPSNSNTGFMFKNDIDGEVEFGFAQAEKYLVSAYGEITDDIAPIFTEGTAVTTGVKPTFNQANHSNSLGPYYFEFDSNGADQDLLTAGSDTFLKIVSTEQLLNSNFLTGIQDWIDDSSGTGSSQWDSVNQAMGLTSDGTSNQGRAYQSFVSEIGKEYHLTAGRYLNLILQIGNGVGGSSIYQSNNGSETIDLVFTATSTETFITLLNFNGTYEGRFSYVSVMDDSAKVLALTDQTTQLSLPCPAGEHTAGVLMEAGAESSVWKLTGTQYGTLSTPVNFTGDCEIELVVSNLSATGPYSTLLGSTASGAFIRFEPTNILTYYDGIGYFLIVDDPIITSGEIFTIKLVQTGGTLVAYLNGIASNSTNVRTLVGKEFNDIGRLSTNTRYGEGNIYSITFTDLVTPANSQTHIFDSGNTDYQFAEEGGLGSELVANGGFDTDLSNWTIYSTPPVSSVTWEDGKARVVTDGTWVSIVQDHGVSPGEYVKWSLVSTLNAGNQGAVQQGSYGKLLVSGDNEDVFTITDTQAFTIKRNGGLSGPSDFSIDDVSIKQVNKACFFANVVAGDWIQAQGTKQLFLDNGYSAIQTYDNALGSGNLVCGIDVRELKRYGKDTIAGQASILPQVTGLTLITDGGDFLTDDSSNQLVT